jgi:hypothetical protein
VDLNDPGSAEDQGNEKRTDKGEFVSHHCSLFAKMLIGRAQSIEEAYSRSRVAARRVRSSTWAFLYCLHLIRLVQVGRSFASA